MSKSERVALRISALLILICFIAIGFYDVIGSDTSSTQQLGYLSEISNDIRHKNNGKVFWRSAKRNQGINSGDKVFTGKKSSAKIVMKNKSSFYLSESSLVEFKDYNKENLPDFSIGNFTISVKGHIKVLINGKIADIQGDNSQVTLLVDKKKNVTFKVNKGNTNIAFQEKAYSLNERRPTANFISDKQDPVAEASTTQNLAAARPPEIFEHILGLYDIYEKNAGSIVYKKQNLNIIAKKISLSIDGLLPSDFAHVEHASNSSFMDSQRLHVSGTNTYLAKAYVGQNFWRYSSDQEKWSVTMKFTVNTSLLANSKPSVRSKPTVLLDPTSAKAQFEVSAPIDTTGYIVEYSKNMDFISDQTKLYFFYNQRITLTFNKSGHYYTRFRAVDKDLRLGEWSDVQELEVLSAPELSAPRWVKTSYESMVDEVNTLEWQNLKNAKTFSIAILDAEKNVFFKTSTASTKLDWIASRSGSYFAVLTATDKYGRVSPPSKLATLMVTSPIMQLTKKTRPKRMLTSTDLSSAVQVDQIVPNKIYIHSTASFGSSYYTFQSSTQTRAAEPSTSPGVVASLLVWMNNHGIEGIVQKNVPSSSSTNTAEADILSADVRYRYRLTPTDMNYVRGFQTSVFAGYELYRNSDSAFFLEKYDLLKLGLTLDIPFFDRWLMAGQLAYGTGSSVTKSEASMNLDYFFKRNWSMGAGYRINLIEAQNSTQFPTFSVFREGYANGVLNVKYFF